MPFSTIAHSLPSAVCLQQISPALLCFLLRRIFLPCSPFQPKSSLRKIEYFSPGQSCSFCLHKQLSLQMPALGNPSYYQRCCSVLPRCVTCWWLLPAAPDSSLPMLYTYWGGETSDAFAIAITSLMDISLARIQPFTLPSVF